MPRHKIDPIGSDELNRNRSTDNQLRPYLPFSVCVCRVKKENTARRSNPNRKIEMEGSSKESEREQYSRHICLATDGERKKPVSCYTYGVMKLRRIKIEKEREIECHDNLRLREWPASRDGPID